MWSNEAVAPETAAVGRSFAAGVSLRSRRVWCPRTLSPSPSCTRLVQLLLSVAISLQLLLSTGRMPTLWCSAAVSERRLLKSFASFVPFPPKQQSEEQLSRGAGGAFAQLASAAAAALRRKDVAASILEGPDGAARRVPAPSVDGTDRRTTFDDEDQYAGKEEREGQAFSTLTTEDVKKLTQALNYFLNTAKQEVQPSEEEALTRRTGERLRSSTLGWSFQETTPSRGGTQGSFSLEENTTLSGRPAWLLPDHRSSLTRMSVPPRESGTCPAVGGFGHPLGRRYEGLEDWGGLLCRSGGMLRKTNSPDLAYDTFVLVKGYRGGDAPLEESLSVAGDDLSSSGDNISINGISGISGSGSRSEEFGVSFDALGSGRTWREEAGSSREAQQKRRASSKECNTENSSPCYRKTEAQLEDELNEVIDMLSMLHCHLANVVDLRHPSNIELYANIRRVALLRANVLRRRNQVTLRVPDEQGVFVVPVVKQQGQRQANDIPATYHFATQGNNAEDSAPRGMGVMRGQHSSTFSKSSRASYSSRRHATRDMQEGKFALYETARGAASGMPGFSGKSYLPLEEEESESELLKSILHAPERLNFEQNIRAPLLSSLQDEEGSLPAEEREDDSGPVLVVVRNFTDPERVFFGVREIREFLFSRLLKTAYEVRAYNEFKRHLFALWRNKRSLRVRKTAINTERGLLSRFYSSPVEYSTQERIAAAVRHAARAAASRARKFTEQEEGTQGSKSTGSSTVQLTKKAKRPLLTKKFSLTDWFKKGSDTNAPVNTSVDERMEFDIGQDTFVVPPSERPSTKRDHVSPVAGIPRESLAQRQVRTSLPAWTSLSVKDEEEPWWAHLGLRFDLYISLAGATAEGVTVSPTASLLRLVSEPRMRKLVCVYNYDDPKTDIPPILRANGSVGLPALVLGRRFTTGARSIARLLISIAEYEPPFPYSLEQYAPRFLVTEPIFSEVLASARLTRKPVMYPRTTRVR